MNEEPGKTQTPTQHVKEQITALVHGNDDDDDVVLQLSSLEFIGIPEDLSVLKIGAVNSYLIIWV